MAHLFFLMKAPEQPTRVLIWDTRTLSIGRSSENDLTLDDDEISRKHALLINEEGVCEIGDYRTGNGTFVNGQRVRGKQKIEPGNVIGVGKLQLEFRQSQDHPAKLGHKLEFASQLKTAGMLPQGADAGTTMLGLADTAPPSDEFVIEPERASGGQAFLAGDDANQEFQMRELGDSLDQIELEIGDDLELLDLADPPSPSKPSPGKPSPSKPPPRTPSPSKPRPRAPGRTAAPAPTPAPAEDPTDRLRKLKGLHDEGLITDAEFQAKRAQILKEM